MKKFLTLIAISCITALFIPKTARAQLPNPPPPWAAGQISLEYVGPNENLCSQKNTPYIITLEHYRDYAPTNLDWPDKIDVVVKSKELGIEEIVTLNTKVEQGQIQQYCLNGNPVATEGAWYSNDKPYKFERADDWRIFTFGETRSTEYLNINPGQTFSITTRLNNAPCGTVEFDGKKYTNKVPTSTPTYIRPHPVISFCAGIDKNYQYNFPAVDKDNDKVVFSFAPATNHQFGGLQYEGLFSAVQPFPSSSFIDLTKSGVLSFTPRIRYSSLMAVKVVEERPYYRLETVNNEVRLDSTSFAASITQREMRVVFDNNCNKRLPEFEGVERIKDKNTGQIVYKSRYNAKEDAYEFDCATTEMIFNLSQPMFCNTLDKNDFRIALSYDGIDTVITAIDEAIPSKCVNNEFDQVTLKLHIPIGPGQYNLFFKYGSNDSITIRNRCEFDIPINKPWTKIYVNTDFTYKHPKDQYTYCDPADDLPKAKAVKPGGQLKVPARVFYTWQRQPQNPKSEIDTVFAEDTELINGSRGSIKEVWAEDNPSNPVTYDIWEVGAGFDYSIYDPFTGDTIEKKICYDTDQFRVTRYKNPPVEIPDYDLCPDDDWPVINLDSMVTKHNAIIKDFVWRSFMEFPKKLLSSEELDHENLWSITRAGYSNFGVPGALTNRYNYFSSAVPLDINGHICIERDTFVVVKEKVRANLGNDSIICPGEEYVLRNNQEYLSPDSLTYQWFINDSMIVDNTTDTIMISEKGEYRLDVVKNTIVGTICIGSDSTRIILADSLYPPEVACHLVTFKDGIVQQDFATSSVKGAEGYQVRSIDPDGNISSWADATGQYGTHEMIKGAQMKAQFRAVNLEVPIEAPCRFGPASNIAEACEVIVKTTNVFTPNGDGINDFLAFDLLELFPGSRLQVFNRFGKLIFEDNDYYNDWDGGKYKSGTYFYILDVNHEDYGIFKGNFTIIRD